MGGQKRLPGVSRVANKNGSTSFRASGYDPSDVRSRRPSARWLTRTAGSSTGKSAEADYVYVMDFDGDKIRHMTKIWNDGFAMQQLGWA